MSNFTNSVETLFNKMEGFLSSKTVVGEPIHIGDVIIVPLVELCVGVGAGSFESKNLTDSKENKERTGGGLGAKIIPSAILVIQDGAVQLVDTKSSNGVNKLIDMVPGIMSKFDFTSIFNKKGENIEDEQEQE